MLQLVLAMVVLIFEGVAFGLHYGSKLALRDTVLSFFFPISTMFCAFMLFFTMWKFQKTTQAEKKSMVVDLILNIVLCVDLARLQAAKANESVEIPVGLIVAMAVLVLSYFQRHESYLFEFLNLQIPSEVISSTLNRTTFARIPEENDVMDASVSEEIIITAIHHGAYFIQEAVGTIDSDIDSVKAALTYQSASRIALALGSDDYLEEAAKRRCIKLTAFVLGDGNNTGARMVQYRALPLTIFGKNDIVKAQFAEKFAAEVRNMLCFTDYKLLKKDIIDQYEVQLVKFIASVTICQSVMNLPIVTMVQAYLQWLPS